MSLPLGTCANWPFFPTPLWCQPDLSLRSMSLLRQLLSGSALWTACAKNKKIGGRFSKGTSFFSFGSCPWITQAKLHLLSRISFLERQLDPGDSFPNTQNQPPHIPLRSQQLLGEALSFRVRVPGPQSPPSTLRKPAPPKQMPLFSVSYFGRLIILGSFQLHSKQTESVFWLLLLLLSRFSRVPLCATP